VKLYLLLCLSFLRVFGMTGELEATRDLISALREANNAQREYNALLKKNVEDMRAIIPALSRENNALRELNTRLKEENISFEKEINLANKTIEENFSLLGFTEDDMVMFLDTFSPNAMSEIMGESIEERIDNGRRVFLKNLDLPSLSGISSLDQVINSHDNETYGALDRYANSAEHQKRHEIWKDFSTTGQWNFRFFVMHGLDLDKI
jgi:hypothetical protein